MCFRFKYRVLDVGETKNNKKNADVALPGINSQTNVSDGCLAGPVIGIMLYHGTFQSSNKATGRTRPERSMNVARVVQ